MSKNRKLLETLLDAHKNRRSGVLRVERASEKKQLVLSNGLLVFAESNVPQEHLVRVLVKLDLLPRAKVNEIASSMKSGRTSEEAILALSDLNMQDLEKGRLDQAILILSSLLSWNGCEMHFYQGESLVRYHLNLGLSLPEILVTSARRAVADRLVQMPQSFMQGTLCIAEDFPGNVQDLPLDAAESSVLSFLNQPVNALDAISFISTKNSKPELILNFLFALGIIRLKDPEKRSDETPAAAKANPIIQLLDDTLARFEEAGLYEILSIPVEAAQDDIQTAYHNLARQFHPDRYQSREFSEETRGKAEQIFTYINKAYITLKDPELRADYDEKRLTKESKVEAGLKARAAKQSEDEKTAEALYRDGKALLADGNVEDAIERLKGSVWLNPGKAVYQHYLGLAESEVPKLRKSAEQHLLKAIELDKTAMASRLELAKLYIKVELRRKAEQQLQELMRWDPENPEVLKLSDELQKHETAHMNRSNKNPSPRF